MEEEREKFTNTKSIVVGAIVLVVIIASFWLSFSLGKKVFVPINPEEKEEKLPLESTLTVPEGISTKTQLTSAVQTGLGKEPEVALPKIEVKVTPLLETKKEVVTAPEKKPAPAAPIRPRRRRPLNPVQPKPQPKVTQPAPAAPATTEKKWLFYYKVLAGSFSKDINARQLAVQLKAKGFPVYIDKITVGGQNFFRVQTGAFTKKAEAETMLTNLKASGFEGSMVVE